MRFTSREIIHDAMRCARQAYMIALALPVERMPIAKASMPKVAASFAWPARTVRDGLRRRVT
jgi:hypothetical protein